MPDVGGTSFYADRTPSFCWRPAQSAVRYRWELYQGGVRTQYKDVMLPCYAPVDTINDGTYTWKVWSIDARGGLRRRRLRARSPRSPQLDRRRSALGDGQLTVRWNR